MKRMLAFLLCIAAILSLSACSKQDAPEQNKDQTQTQTDGAGTKDGDQDDQKSVDVTFPAFLFEDTDLSTLDTAAYAEQQGFESVKVNEDNSLTATMSKEKYDAFMEETKTGLADSYAQLIESEEAPYILDITHADDFSTIDIKVNKAGYDEGGLETAFIPFLVYTPAALYQSLVGAEPKAEIRIVDADTQEIISSVVYPDDLTAQQ